MRPVLGPVTLVLAVPLLVAGCSKDAKPAAVQTTTAAPAPASQVVDLSTQQTVLVALTRGKDGENRCVADVSSVEAGSVRVRFWNLGSEFSGVAVTTVDGDGKPDFELFRIPNVGPSAVDGMTVRLDTGKHALKCLPGMAGSGSDFALLDVR